jgi:hypothetical protein
MGNRNEIRRAKNENAVRKLFGEKSAGNPSGFVCSFIHIELICADEVICRGRNGRKTNQWKA